MKKALKLLFTFISIMIAGIGIGSLLYSLYLNILNSVAGTKIVLFELNTFMDSLFYISAIMIVLIFPLIAFIHIRNKSGISVLITYIILGVITWTLGFNSLLFLESKYDQKHPDVRMEKNLSGGYFRRNGNDVYYFAKDLPSSESDQLVTSVIIDTTQNGIVKTEKINADDCFILENASEPYKDIIIKNTFRTDKRNIIFSFSSIINQAKDASSKGFTFWLGFISIGFLLCSMFAISNTFQWKLMNVCGIIVTTIVILFINSTFLTIPAISSIVNKINNLSFFRFLENYVNNPVLVLVNIICGIVFIIMGTTRYFVIRKKNK